MSWQDERERLLTDTIAFVQQTLGDSLVFAVRSKASLTPEIEAAARELRRFHDRPKPQHLTDLRDELASLTEALHNMQRPMQTGAALASATAPRA